MISITMFVAKEGSPLLQSSTLGMEKKQLVAGSSSLSVDLSEWPECALHLDWPSWARGSSRSLDPVHSGIGPNCRFIDW